jgi:hypothetical protein
MLQSDLVAGLVSLILDPTVFPARVNLLLQREDSVGQPVGNHADSIQVMLFHEIYLLGQRRNMGAFKGDRFFTPRPLNSGSWPTKGGRLGSWFSQ